MTLVHSDNPLEVVGLVDITDPARPRPLGSIATEGEPTSVATLGQTAYVAINTSESFVEPSSHRNSRPIRPVVPTLTSSFPCVFARTPLPPSIDSYLSRKAALA